MPKPDFLLTPAPHTEAMDFIRSKPALASRIFGELLPELRARAFTITGVEHHDTLQRVRDLIAEIPGGADWDKTKRQIVAEVSPFFVGKSRGTDGDGNPLQVTPEQAEAMAASRAELLMRMHGFQAFSASAWRTMDAQRDVFPYWQYQSMGDQKVRDTHAALDGKILPADSEFWRNHYPPWEWGCRCQAIPRMEDEVDDIRREQAGRPLEERDVLEGAALAKVESERKLVLGPNQIFDLRTQREKGNPDGYEFRPGDLRIPLETLRSRYDDAVWGKFEAWAQATGIPETGATVWEWLGGKRLAPTGKLAKTTAATVRPFAALAPDLDAIIAEPALTREQRRERMHAALELPKEFQSTIGYRNPQTEPNVDEGFSFVRRVVAASVLAGPAVEIRHSRDRACADSMGGYINGRKMQTATVVHEMGHIIEARSPSALAKSLAFRDRRTVGEQPQWLGPGYHKSERGLPDEWAARGGRQYSGKVYRMKSSGRDYATEILSMGLQRLLESPAEFYQNDRDYFEYVVNCTRGL